MIKDLEINHLKTLEILFRVESISLAAEHLQVSQQAVSLQLKKIRKIVGDDLFVRTGHGMAPTSYAKFIEPQIRQVLTLLSEIPAPGSLDSSQTSRTLVISATDYAQKVVVAELIQRVRQYAPKVKFIVTNIESVSLTQKMHQGEIDLAFTSAGYVPDGINTQVLFNERYVCISANPMYSLDELVPIDQLMQSDFVITSPGVGGLRGSADRWLEGQGLKREIVVSAPSFYIAQEFLKRTDTLAFIPSRLMPCEGLVEITLDKYPPGYEVVAAFHPRVENDPLVSWILNDLHQRFSKSMAS
ncbi:LysR family transcriptional regulator [Microbulbifer sp. JMSA003]|uniref:LysR family transcriptional regulator n=1 Tax=Microbulbifer sp. JMSA003 TaxID=3243369 RepID=UPI004039643A